jgi:S1-C subfamily serine protease
VDSLRSYYLEYSAVITTHIALGVAGIWILVRLLRLSWSVMARKDGGIIVGAALLSSAVVMSIVAICFFTAVDEYWWSVREAERELARQRRIEAAESRVASLDPEPGEQIDWRRELPGENDLLVLTNSDFNPRIRGSLYKRTAAAVVTLDRGRYGHGTAFLITRDGLALTNEHVVDGAGHHVARFEDGREAPARVIRSSADVDVALIQIACVVDCLTVPLGTDSEIEPAMDVMVIGTPWERELHHTATKGVVSALRYEQGMTLVQVDAPVNGGNSGSPILDLRTGHALGIISFSRRGAEDLNFGVSISDALRELGVRVENR